MDTKEKEHCVEEQDINSNFEDLYMLLAQVERANAVKDRLKEVIDEGETLHV